MPISPNLRPGNPHPKQARTIKSAYSAVPPKWRCFLLENHSRAQKLELKKCYASNMQLFFSLSVHFFPGNFVCLCLSLIAELRRLMQGETPIWCSGEGDVEFMLFPKHHRDHIEIWERQPMLVISAPRRQRWEDHGFEASLGYIARPSLRKKD